MTRAGGGGAILRAVVPAAGLGTRMLPVTRAVPKELLPLLTLPALHHTLAEAAAAGIAEVVVVTAPRPEKAALARYLAQPPPDHPRAAPLRRLLARVRVTFVEQPEPRGLGDAIARARPAVGAAPFAVLLPDDVFLPPGPGPLPALVASWEREGRRGAHVALRRVAREAVSRYGVASGRPAGPGRLRIQRIVEKPRPEDAPSDLALPGRYLLPPEAFDVIGSLAPGRGGEVQLGDALDAMTASAGGLFGVIHEGAHHDIGEVTGWLLANAHLGLQAGLPGLAEGLRALLGDDG